MRLSTKTVATLLVATAAARASSDVRQRPWDGHRKSQFDRLLQRHDRKGELRAEILGLDPLTFRDMQKHMTLEVIVRQNGFRNTKLFLQALFGRLKGELRRRGWTTHRIESYLALRRERLTGYRFTRG